MVEVQDVPHAQYVIVGAGAIGGTIGGFMAQAGQDILLVDTASDHVDAINERGLKIEGWHGTVTVPVKATLPSNLPETLCAVLLATKEQATEVAVRAIRDRIAAHGFVVSIQNGLCNEERIAGLVGIERTIGCLVNVSADYMAPGVIKYGGPGTVMVGELDGRASGRVREVVRRLSAVCEAGSTGNIKGYLWGKEAYGAMVAASALSSDPMAECIDENRDVMAWLAREVLEVAVAAGETPEGFDGFEPWAYLSREPEAIDESIEKIVDRRRKNGKKYSGVWRDIAIRKRKTEVESHLAPILVEAERVGVDVAGVRAVGEMIREVENGQRPQNKANLQELVWRLGNGE